MGNSQIGGNLRLKKVLDMSSASINPVVAKLFVVGQKGEESNMTVTLTGIKLQNMVEFESGANSCTAGSPVVKICLNNCEKGLTIIKNVIYPIDMFMYEKLNIGNEYGDLLFSSCMREDENLYKILRVGLNSFTKICYIDDDHQTLTIQTDIIKSPIFSKLFDLECEVDFVIDFSEVIRLSKSCVIDVKCLYLTFRMNLSGIEMKCPICRESNVVYPFEKKVKGLDTLCCVCKYNPVNVYFTNCGHINMCMDCIITSKGY
jgi:hypothetical protein